MTDDMKHRLLRVEHHLLRIITPLLLVGLIYFLKPIVDAVPQLEKKADVAAAQQQAIVNQMAEVSVKQERVSAQVVQVGTKVEILSEKVSRLERKIDD